MKDKILDFIYNIGHNHSEYLKLENVIAKQLMTDELK